jgi:hypothetical protein
LRLNEDLRFMAKEPENNPDDETTPDAPSAESEAAPSTEPEAASAAEEPSAPDASASDADATSEPEVSEEP